MEESPLDNWESEGGSLLQSPEDDMVNENYTHIAVIADRSGSMMSIAPDMNGGLRTFFDEQSEVEGDLKVDIVTFDSQVEKVLTDGKVEDITFPIIVPRGTTALNDAVGSTITSLGERFSNLSEDERPGKVIILIITDGYENSSREYTSEQIKNLVTEQQDKWNWDFVFLGANIDAFAVGVGYGFAKGGTLNYEASSAGVASVLRSAGEYVTTSRVVGNATFTRIGNRTYVGQKSEEN